MFLNNLYKKMSLFSNSFCVIFAVLQFLQNDKRLHETNYFPFCFRFCEKLGNIFAIADLRMRDNTKDFEGEGG